MGRLGATGGCDTSGASGGVLDRVELGSGEEWGSSETGGGENCGRRFLPGVGGKLR